MHAVFVTVAIDPASVEESQHALREQVVPRVKASSGFVRGFWTAGDDPTRGVSLVVFESAQDAENAAKMVRDSPMPPGVTLREIEVRTVVADA